MASPSFTLMNSDESHQDLEKILEELGPIGIVVVAVTLIAFFLFTISIEYTIGDVVATLTMVETPQSTVLLRDDDPDSKLTEPLIDGVGDPEVILVRQSPITSKIRTTLRHLTTRAGWYSRWRGVSLAICIRLLVGAVVGLFGNIYPSLMPLWKIIATLAVARLLMGWTHIVISEPSPKRWTKRLLPLRSWKKIWGPTAVFAIAKELVVGLPLMVAVLLFSPDAKMGPEDTAEPMKIVAVKTMAIVLVGLASWIGIFIPAQVTLVRCQASLLSESEEPIVPFDRTFGGKIAPYAVGNTRIGFLDAWRSFDALSRTRLLKFYVKYFLIQFGVFVLFAIVFSGELLFFLDKDTRKMAQRPNNIVSNIQLYAQHVGL